MNESDFSWYKILSFFCAAILAFLTFVMVACSIHAFAGDHAFSGVICLICGALSGFGVWSIYQYYQRKSNDGKSGTKSK